MGSHPGATGPSRLWYGVGGALVAVAMIGGMFMIASAVGRTLDRVRDFQRVGVPGAEDVRLDRSGPYTIYYEGPGLNTSDDEVLLPTVRVSVQRLEDGSFLSLRRYGGRFTYDLEGHEGAAIFTFRSPGPGIYRIESEADLAPGQAELALGRSITGGIVRDALVTGLVCFLVFVGGVVVLIVTAVRRFQAHRPPTPTGAPYPPYPPPPPPSPPPPPLDAPPPRDRINGA